jgi:hypothetical protein
MLDRKAKSIKHEQSRMVLKIIVELTLFIHSTNSVDIVCIFNNSFWSFKFYLILIETQLHLNS